VFTDFRPLALMLGVSYWRAAPSVLTTGRPKLTPRPALSARRPSPTATLRAKRTSISG